VGLEILRRRLCFSVGYVFDGREPSGWYIDSHGEKVAINEVCSVGYDQLGVHRANPCGRVVSTCLVKYFASRDTSRDDSWSFRFSKSVFSRPYKYDCGPLPYERISSVAEENPEIQTTFPANVTPKFQPDSKKQQIQRKEQKQRQRFEQIANRRMRSSMRK
jgi:hypothetical protein